MLISNTMIEIPLQPDQKNIYKKILANASWDDLMASGLSLNCDNTIIRLPVAL